MTARVICVANRKGGVGETTTAVNVAAELGDRGRRVLVIDLDTQAHASPGLGAVVGLDHPGAHSVFRETRFGLESAVRSGNARGVDVLPPEREFQIHDSVSDPLRFARAIKPLAERCDDFVIDTAPAIDVVTISALAAADSLLIPTQLQHLAYDGVARFSRVLLKVTTMLNRSLAEFAVVPIQIDLRVNLQRRVHERLLGEYGRYRVFHGIRVDIALAEAFGAGSAVRDYKPHSHGAADYASLADDILSLWNA